MGGSFGGGRELRSGDEAWRRLLRGELRFRRDDVACVPFGEARARLQSPRMPRRTTSPTTLAAVDLGSNSFRMVLADVDDGALRRRDSLREGVRLAAALGPDGRLTAEGEARALACLARFGERVRELPPSNVRAVGTNTLRRARG